MRSRWDLQSVSNRLCLLVLLVVVAAACERTQVTLAALKSRDIEWASRLSALRNRQVEVAARFAQLPATPGSGDATSWEARRRRLEASVEGSKQTLADVDGRRRQSVQEVEAALQRGGHEGEDALGAASAQMGTFLASQEQELASTEAALAGIGNGIGNGERSAP